MMKKIDFSGQNLNEPNGETPTTPNGESLKIRGPKKDAGHLTDAMFVEVSSVPEDASVANIILPPINEGVSTSDQEPVEEKQVAEVVPEVVAILNPLGIEPTEKKAVPVRNETPEVTSTETERRKEVSSVSRPASETGTFSEQTGAEKPISFESEWSETLPAQTSSPNTEVFDHLSKEDRLIIFNPDPEPYTKNSVEQALVRQLLKSPKEIGQEIIANLPRPLRRLLEVLKKKAHKDLALITYLATMSGICPNYMGNYNEDWLESNLYLMILAPFAEGKGFTRKFQKALDKIDDRLEAQNLAAVKEYKALLKEYKSGDGAGEEPEKPKTLMLTMPIDNSKAGLVYLLNENKGRGFLFETEIDVLVEALKQDYGNYSPTIRQAYHHEALKNFRKGLLTYIKIKKLYLSIILTGTFGQFFSMIPNIENGLFSRFTFFIMEPDPKFDVSFSNGKSEIEKRFEEMAEYFDCLHFSLQQREENPIIFELQPHQQEHFREFNQMLKTEFAENVNKETQAIINRWAVMCYRIFMILSMLRLERTGNLPDTIICSDDDYYNGVELFKILKLHAMSMYYQMPPVKLPQGTEEEYAPTVKQKMLPEARELQAQGLSYREISMALFNSKTKQQTIYRWLNS